MKLLTENATKSLIDRLFQGGIDATLNSCFYSAPMLKAYLFEVSEYIIEILSIDGQIKAFLPGKLSNANIFESLSHNGWDQLDVVAADDSSRNKLIGLLVEKYKTAVLKNFSPDSPVSRSDYGAFRAQSFKCPFVTLPDSLEVYMNSLSGSFRKTVNRKLNRFEKESGKIIIEKTTGTEKNSLENTFSDLIALHSKRAEESGIKTRFNSKDSVEFHRRLLDEATGSDNFKIIFFKAQIENKTISVYYCYQYGNKLFYFNSGIDPDFNDYSPGVVVLSQIVRYAIDNRLEYFEFLRGTEKYKFHWTDKTRQNFHYYLANKPIPKAKAFSTFFRDQRQRFGARKTFTDLLAGRFQYQ